MGSSKILGSGEPQSEGLIVDARRTNCSHTKCASWRFNPQIDPLKKVCHIERGKEHAFLFFCRSICESSFEKLQKIREAIFFSFKIPKIKPILLRFQVRALSGRFVAAQGDLISFRFHNENTGEVVRVINRVTRARHLIRVRISAIHSQFKFTHLCFRASKRVPSTFNMLCTLLCWPSSTRTAISTSMRSPRMGKMREFRR